MFKFLKKIIRKWWNKPSLLLSVETNNLSEEDYKELLDYIASK